MEREYTDHTPDFSLNTIIIPLVNQGVPKSFVKSFIFAMSALILVNYYYFVIPTQLVPDHWIVNVFVTHLSCQYIVFHCPPYHHI